MNTRILTVVATVTLLSLSSGCSGMRNFLFGRGASCGLCNTQRAPVFPRLNQRLQRNVPAPVTAPAPTQGLYGQQPCSSCGNTPARAPTYAPALSTAQEPGCGYERGYAREIGCGNEAIANQCECGGVMSGYGSTGYGHVVQDPYMSGDMMGGYPVNGQIIGQYPTDGTIIGGGVLGSDNWVPAPVDSQGYRSNKFDNDGAKIISEEPLPPSMTPLN